MTRSIITGASGFVGANLARRLLGEGHEVHLLLRPGYASWRIEDLRKNVLIYEVDLVDAERLDQTLRVIRPEVIFHLAAYGTYASQTDIRQMIQTNIAGTANLVEAALKVGFESFVNTGTSSEYGFKSYAPCEDSLIEPNSAYAVTKASATLFCQYVAHKHKVNLSTLRLYSVYGPYEEPTRLVPELILHGQRGTLPPLANPTAAHDFVYIDDVCNAYLLAAGRSGARFGEIYNVGTGTQTTLREVVEIARKVMTITAQPKWDSMPERLGDTESWVANPRKIQVEMGWFPQNTFEQGFSRTIKWFQDKPPIRELYERVAAQNAI
jgi:nucleoside-diphosphate-sugar epimerase